MVRTTESRQPLRDPHRILIGTHETGGILPDFADGFRQLGHRTTTVNDTPNPFYPELKYDVDLTNERPKLPEVIANSRSVTAKIRRRMVNRPVISGTLLKLIAAHDVFIFVSGTSSLIKSKWEYPLLKALGKTIVSAFCGSDIRHISAYAQQFGKAEGVEFDPESVMKRKGGAALRRTLQNLRRGERFSDLIISVPNQSGLAVRPYMHFFLPINLSTYSCNVVGRDIPLVVHAPSRRSVKGTDSILAALEQLRLDGVQFELRLLERVPNHQVRAQLAEADVVIDQLYCNLHGKLGVEAMASGCALATCNREDCDPIPPNRPIWHIEKSNIYGQLKRLLTDKELRVRLAHEGRKHVERYHDHVNVARRIVKCIDDEIEGYDHYPTFLARDYQLPPGEQVPANLKRMTARIVQRWGLPAGVDPQDMIMRGLMSGGVLDCSKPVPRW